MRYATILSAKLEIGTTHREIRICPAADRCQGTREWPQRRPSGRIIVANDRKIALKTQDLSPLMKSLISKILRRLLGCHQGDLLDDARRRRLLGHERQFEMVDCAVHRAAAKLPQEPALELKEYPEHLEDREDDLAVRNVQEERLPHPRRPGPRLCPVVYFRRTRPWIKATGEWRAEGSSLDSPHSQSRLA